MGQTGNLFVVDEEFKRRGGELIGHRNFFSEVLIEYLSVMDNLMAHSEGASKKALAAMVESLRSRPDSLINIGMSYQSDCDNFVIRIDEADSFLY